jgi:hypothetical protein
MGATDRLRSVTAGAVLGEATSGTDTQEVRVSDDKLARMRVLVEARRRVPLEGEFVGGGYTPGRFKRIGDFHSGAYECSEHVSPLSIRAANLDARIVIMAQDWSSSSDMAAAPRDGYCGYDSKLPTNGRLDKLLDEHFRLTRADVFATNLFPFIKTGGMSARIPPKDLVRAAKEFALPQVEIVGPQLVVCLGLPTFNAIRRAVGVKPVATVTAGVEQPLNHKGVRYWCQAHTGGLGTANRNRRGADGAKVDRVKDDWALMAAWFRCA